MTLGELSSLIALEVIRGGLGILRWRHGLVLIFFNTKPMGKRKSRKKTAAPKKKREKLETVFSCPFCNHENSVECHIDMKNMIGELACRICQESFSTAITGKLNALSEPIDIYSEWIDECERVNKLEEEGEEA
ncbi:transcription elongation factor 1 homolog isoform X3 [Arachis ipaensis]|uniref:transcription elongation factor 1 homolog isoform X3 n=1 Tax=Arachis ipaensis TaxID=130454 RepID=UPI000A2B5930|nr:transcription elongation factor 1 homolog isoform X3 [Arachis ipaensis]